METSDTEILDSQRLFQNGVQSCSTWCEPRQPPDQETRITTISETCQLQDLRLASPGILKFITEDKANEGNISNQNVENNENILKAIRSRRKYYSEKKKRLTKLPCIDDESEVFTSSLEYQFSSSAEYSDTAHSLDSSMSSGRRVPFHRNISYDPSINFDTLSHHGLKGHHSLLDLSSQDDPNPEFPRIPVPLREFRRRLSRSGSISSISPYSSIRRLSDIDRLNLRQSVRSALDARHRSLSSDDLNRPGPSLASSVRQRLAAFNLPAALEGSDEEHTEHFNPKQSRSTDCLMSGAEDSLLDTVNNNGMDNLLKCKETNNNKNTNVPSIGKIENKHLTRISLDERSGTMTKSHSELNNSTDTAKNGNLVYYRRQVSLTQSELALNGLDNSQSIDRRKRSTTDQGSGGGNNSPTKWSSDRYDSLFRVSTRRASIRNMVESDIDLISEILPTSAKSPIITPAKHSSKSDVASKKEKFKLFGKEKEEVSEKKVNTTDTPNHKVKSKPTRTNMLKSWFSKASFSSTESLNKAPVKNIDAADTKSASNITAEEKPKNSRHSRSKDRFLHLPIGSLEAGELKSGKDNKNRLRSHSKSLRSLLIVPFEPGTSDTEKREETVEFKRKRSKRKGLHRRSSSMPGLNIAGKYKNTDITASRNKLSDSKNNLEKIKKEEKLSKNNEKVDQKVVINQQETNPQSQKAASVFNRKPQLDIKKLTSRLLDTKKDTSSRLKQLKLLTEQGEYRKVKDLYKQNFSTIYVLLHDGFTAVEPSYSGRTHKEDVEILCYLLQKLLCLLPELVYARWQFHSIGRILQKLLSPGNLYRIREDGMRLFTLWYAILMDNASDECHATFHNLVSQLSNTDGKGESGTGSDKHNNTSSNRSVNSVLSTLLHSSVTQICLIDWSDTQLQISSFYFLFDKFKLLYLTDIFYHYDFNTDIYMPEAEAFLAIPALSNVPGLSERLQMQEAVLKWILCFSPSSHLPPKPLPSVLEPYALLELKELNPFSQYLELLNHAFSELFLDNFLSTCSTTFNRQDTSVSFGILAGDSDSSSILTCSNVEEKFNNSTRHTAAEHAIVRTVLLCCRENVNVVFEILRQFNFRAFLILINSPRKGSIVRTVLLCCRENVNVVFEMLRQAFFVSLEKASITQLALSIYEDWFQAEEVPLFMLEPDTMPEATSTPEASPDPDINLLEVRAGLMKIVRVYVAQSMAVFMSNWKQLVPVLLNSARGKTILDEQVDICRRVLSTYRYIATKMKLDEITWSHMLQMLLKITSHVLDTGSSSSRFQSVSERLAQPLLQTLLVMWIKASACIQVSDDLWDQLLSVLSSLTDWAELVHEWAACMNVLTSLLARVVYDVDVKNSSIVRSSKSRTKSKRLSGASKRTSGFSVTSEGSGNLKLHTDREIEFSTSTPDQSPTSVSLLAVRRHMHKTCNGSAPASPLTPLKILHAQSISSLLSDSLTPTSNNTLTLTRSASETNVSLSNHHPARVGGVNCQSGLIDKQSCDNRREEEGLVCTNGHLTPDSATTEPTTSSSVFSDIITPTDDVIITNDYKRGGKSLSSGYMSDDVMESNNERSSASESFSSYTGESTLRGGETDLSLGDTSPLAEPRSLADNLLDVSTSSASSSGNAASAEYERAIAECSGMSKGDTLKAASVLKKFSPLITGRSRNTSGAGGTLKGGVSVLENGRLVVARLQKIVKHGHGIVSPKRGAKLNDPQSGSELEDDDDNDKEEFPADNLSIVWKRMLGALGDVNVIANPGIHNSVFNCLSEITDRLVKVLESSDKSEGSLSAPIQLIIPWLFQAVRLSGSFMRSKLIAYRLMCICSLQHDHVMSRDHLLRFSALLHEGLVHSKQEVSSTLMKHCSSRLFSMNVLGTSVLVMDFIHATTAIVTASTSLQAPRLEAMTVLGSLLCFPNHFGDIPTFVPHHQEIDVKSVEGTVIKDCIINVLLSGSAGRNPSAITSCVRACSLGIYVYEELVHKTLHCLVPDAINSLLGIVSESREETVCLIAVDMLSLFCSHCDILLQNFPEIPAKIITELGGYIEKNIILLKRGDGSKAIMTSILFCILQWCLSLPLECLMKPITSGSKTSIFSSAIHVLITVLELSSDVRVSIVDHKSKSTAPEFVLSPSSSNKKRGMARANTVMIRDESSEYDVNDTPKSSGDIIRIRLAAKMILKYLTCHVGHHPMNKNGGNDSSVLECSDMDEINVTHDLTSDVLGHSNVQFFMLNDDAILSLVALPVETKLINEERKMAVSHSICRVILRDLSGKFCWDASSLHWPVSRICKIISITGEEDTLDGDTESEVTDPFETDITDRLRSRPAHRESESGTQDFDLIDLLLDHVGGTSPECIPVDFESLNEVYHLPSVISKSADDTTMSNVVQQSRTLTDVMPTIVEESKAQCERRPAVVIDTMEFPLFDTCRQFLRQLGFIDDRRMQIKLLRQDEKLMREIRHLDALRCRETFKLAVIYVADGQNEKQEILSNSSGSASYDQFLSGLGWKVDLSSHDGFLGGFQRSSIAGEETLYYASATKEIMYHVSTMMPSLTEEDRHRKVSQQLVIDGRCQDRFKTSLLYVQMKHIGNDEIHIVWSEDSRDYNHDVIPTKFGDVIIVINPLITGLFHIQILKKDQLIQFGPLFDGAIVDSQVLPGLVLSTAVNASQRLRANTPFYKAFYEERMSSLSDIASRCLQPTAYDEFLAEIYSPGFLHADSTDSHLLPPNTPIKAMLMSASESQDKVDPLPKSKNKKLSAGSPPIGRRARSKSTR